MVNPESVLAFFAYPACYKFLILLVLALATAYLCYRVVYMPYSLFTNLGIPGPRPSAFYGNFKQFSSKGDQIGMLMKWTRKYGKIYGHYRGANPVYVVTDLDILKQVMVKEFSHFVDRQSEESNGFLIGIRGGKSGLLARTGEEWQQIRRIVSPTFTSGKLKMMTQLIEDSCNSLCLRVEKLAESGKADDIWRLYGQFTMETILATAFGYKVELLNGKVDEGDELIQAAQNVFNSRVPSGGGAIGMALLCLNSHFHCLTPLMTVLGSFTPVHSSFITIRKAAMAFVQARRMNHMEKKKDLLQLTIDAHVEDEGINVAGTDTTSSFQSFSQTKKTLTDEDIVAVATDFILAGYETTANTLGYTSYLLALNPDKQDKLYNEINAYFDEHEESGLYDAAMSIEYLDWVIQESLRIYPPGAVTSRYCRKTCNIDGLKFVQGSQVFIPIYILHHSTDYWEDPEEFIPERFHPDEKAKRHPLAHMPFGWGPRNCIGMRFALMEAKMALISMLRKFHFEKCPETEVPLKTRLGITLGPVNGIYLKVLRQQ